MQRFSRRENVPLGCGPQKTLMDSSSAPKSPGRDSEVDFTDVFGGPPRRSSIHETRYSFGEIMDSSSAFRRSDEKLAASRNPWSGLSEKPVFGEEGMSRRRYSRSDFFDDIFGGNESLSSSPRKYEMTDPCAAGSKLLSPARPLPPKAEPFGSSFPAQLSLPSKLNKGRDLPTFGSPPLSRFSGQANQDKEEVRNDFRSSFRSSAFQSTGNEETTNLTGYDEREKNGNSKEDSSSSEISKNGGHFHFSIYKWADQGGVPVAIPLKESDSLKKKDMLQRCSSANGWIACENIAMEPEAKLHNIFCSTDRMSSNAKSFRLELDKNQHGSLIDLINGDGEQGQIIEECNIPKSQTENISRFKSTDKNVPDDTVLHSSEAEENIHSTLSRIDFSAVGKETQMDNARANDRMTKNAGTKDIYERSDKKLSEILDGKSIKKQDVKKRATSNNVEAGTASLKGSPRNSWDDGKSRVRGKVKDFIKIFNQDASSKPSADTISKRHSSRWKERHTVKPENKPNTSMTERGEKIHTADMQTKKSSPDVPVANHMSNGASSKNANGSVNDTASVSNGSNTILGDRVESFEDNFLIEDLMPDEKILLQYGNDPEEIQAIDAKIRQWSNGKQGNIRSLLSTLQYVLWPDSGWKPVPLVDIIEGPAVKRSYQKALLCLHPDKLQQKGAASDQKYIAEKVFDILKDAWTHFNSLNSV